MIRGLSTHALVRLLVAFGWAGIALAGLGVAWPLAALGLPVVAALAIGGLVAHVCDKAALALFDEIGRRS